MPQRLTPLEVSLLVLDTAHAPAHVATVDIFDSRPDGLDYERLIALIRERIAYVPRYRQRFRDVPARLAAPVWVDDESFDLTFHVRRSALPRPGTMEQLREFVGRVVARRMDRSRPLWEMYVVEGLEGDRFAVVAKTHLTLVDGVDNVDIGQVLLDARSEPELASPESWRPVPEPGAAELVAGALWESANDPMLAWQNIQGAATSALGVAVAVGEAVGGVGSTVVELVEDALLGSRPRSKSPLAGVVSEQRRVALVSVPLAELKAVRDEHDHTINDVILAAVTGALRSWLLTRGESVPNGRELTALVPMSVTEDDGEPTSLGSQVAPHLQPLPIGEQNALMRLHQVAYATQAHKDTGRAVDARTLSDIAGFAPTTLHALGVRVSSDVLRRQHDVLVTNVPGPQVTLYAAGERLVASYPVLPLGAGHLLAIGVTSYDGQVFFGLTADRDAVPDLDVLAQCLDDAVEELLDTTVRARALRQPTRKASAAAKKAAASKAAARQEARRGSGQRRAAMRNLATRAVELGTNATRPPAARRPAPSPGGSTARKLPSQDPPSSAEPTGSGSGSEKSASTAAPAKKTPAAQKGAARKSVTKKTAATPTATKKTATKKSASTTTAAKTTAATTAATKKTATKKTATKKTATKETATKETAESSSTARKTTPAARRSAAQKTIPAASPASRAVDPAAGTATPAAPGDPTPPVRAAEVAPTSTAQRVAAGKKAAPRRTASATRALAVQKTAAKRTPATKTAATKAPTTRAAATKAPTTRAAATKTAATKAATTSPTKRTPTKQTRPTQATGGAPAANPSPATSTTPAPPTGEDA